MRAFALGPDGPAVVEVPDVAAGGEAVIRTRLAGVCATDLELVRGYMGFTGVLGHEFVGEVVEAPDARWVGRRVVGDINCPCGACATCHAGRPTHCPRRTVLGILGRDGVFAERFRLPVANLTEVPDVVDDRAAVFVEPLAAALRVLEQVHVRPSDRAVVLGAGRLGQLCARVLALVGAEVLVVSRSEGKLGRLPPAIEGSTDPERGRGADLVLDCTGAPAGLALATRLVRPGGTLVLKTTVHAAEGLTPTPWVIDEVTVVGSRCGPFAPALRLLASGAVDPTPLLDAELPLERGAEALDLARSGAIKVVIRP